MDFILDEVFGHVAMNHFDAALGKIAGETKILPRVPAGRAMRMRTWTPHGRHDQVTGSESRNSSSDFENLPERFMSQDEIVAIPGRATVGKSADFTVGPANSDLDGADLDVGGRADDRGVVLE
jgi:hypothetical protein